MVMKRWHYLINQFLTKSKNNYKKSVKLSNYHDAVLNGNKVAIPLILPLYTRYNPLHNTLVTAYNNWKTVFSNQKSATDALIGLLKSTYAKIDDWDTAIRTALTYNSPEYNNVFDGGRAAFTNSSIEDQVESYQQFSNRLAPYPTLAAVKAEVDAAYVALSDARDAQIVLMSSLKSHSSLVEAARRDAMIMQWRNMGYAMDNFSTNPMFIESLFDIDNLRDKPQTIFTATLSQSENKAVFTRTLLDDDELLLNNDGDADIRFYFADTPNGTNINHIEVLAHNKLTVKMRDFNVPNYGTYRYLTAVNQSTLVDTHYIVTIL